jgi:type 1 glutamine amidotransferase
MTTGDVLNDAQQDAFEHFMRGGGGFVGVHSAADTEYDWPFYGELIVGWFASHPVVQEARVVVQAPEDGVVSFLPNPWQHRDEWYNFRVNPRGRAKILLSVDETSYGGGTMGQDHPIAWHRELGRGRALYTALGHPDEAWQEAALLQHIEAALRWAGHRTDSMPSPTPADARAP